MVRWPQFVVYGLRAGTATSPTTGKSLSIPRPVNKDRFALRIIGVFRLLQGPFKPLVKMNSGH